MKMKYLFAGLFMALLGAGIALFAYSRIIEKPALIQLKDNSQIESGKADALLTSLTMQEGQIDFTYAAEQTVHAVVHVRTKSTISPQASNPIMEYFYGDRYNQPREVKGYGSGVIISSDGFIITNNHVIEDAENIEVKLNDNRTFTAEVVGRDPSTDIALLKIKASGLPFVKYGDSEQLRLGEWVLAVGNPFNLTSTVTAGIVSAKGRNLGILDSDLKIESFIQTDAALNMGNSGGALVNTKGLLVGITSAILSPSGAYAGNSFAIPVTIVKKVVEDLKQYGEVQRAIIGVNIMEVTQEDAEKFKLSEVKGARISSVISDGSAEAAGLKENDIIIKFDGVAVASPSELQEQVGKFRPGDKADITYIRNGKEVTIPITLKNLAGNTNVVSPGTIGTGNVFGARLESLGSADRKKFNVDSGVKVTEVNDGKFKELGLRKGYIILSINGKKVKTASEVRQATDNESELKSIEGIQSNGTFFSYSFRN
ncbi:MAG TPA: deoxyribonuclease HsdR [Bacteroidales bacterium]|nr:deoxyribonuclease HsdR [Bacteroidales bacterium]HBZ21464.1 deoxyribonuclease HsdR [Bacteroidales bacterium]